MKMIASVARTIKEFIEVMAAYAVIYNDKPMKNTVFSLKRLTKAVTANVMATTSKVFSSCINAIMRTPSKGIPRI